MVLGTVDGVIPPEVQGECFKSSDVDALVRGDWHEVDWMAMTLCGQLDYWRDGIVYDGPTDWFEFEPLKRIEEVLCGTFAMLRLDSVV